MRQSAEEIYEMELRDETASRAMAALLVARCPEALTDVRQAVVYAYDYADALLEERACRAAKRGEGPAMEALLSNIEKP